MFVHRTGFLGATVTRIKLGSRIKTSPAEHDYERGLRIKKSVKGRL
jgi:hypothetical protein